MLDWITGSGRNTIYTSTWQKQHLTSIKLKYKANDWLLLNWDNNTLRLNYGCKVEGC